MIMVVIGLITVVNSITKCIMMVISLVTNEVSNNYMMMIMIRVCWCVLYDSTS